MTTRKTYRPSGRMNLGRLALWFVLTLPITLLTGYLLSLVFAAGYFIQFIAPMVAGVLVAGATWLTVWWGHCRNRWVGSAVGSGAALVALLGYYQFDLANHSGIEFLYRVDLLPEYIELRLATDQVKRVGPGAMRDKNNPAQNVPAVQPGDVSAGRWFGFFLDMVCISVMPIAAGWTRAGRPYAEEAQRWLHQHILHVEPAAAPHIVDALDQKDPELLARYVRPIPAKQWDDQGEMRLYYIPYEPRSPVYLTLWVVQGTMRRNQWPQKFATMVRLTKDEAVALNERVRLPGAAFGAEESELPKERRKRSGPGAVIEDLPPEQAGQVLNGRNFALLTIVALGPLALSVLMAIAIVIVLVMRWADLETGVRVGAISAAVVIPLVALILTALFGDYLPNWIQRDMCAAALRKRGDLLVDPDGEGSIYVSIVPRKNWGRLKLENADDLGFLKIDARRRRLLFEGDKQRWTIPADSIVSCEVEEYCIGPPDPNEANVIALVVVTVQLGRKTFEAPLSLTSISPRRPPVSARRKRCRQLRKRIRNELLSDGE